MTMKHTSDNLLDLGRFFHERRVGRGLTLQEVSGEWSAATLSRFERGELDISTQKMLELMTRIGIDELDLLEFYEANPVNFPLQLQDLTLRNTGQMLNSAFLMKMNTFLARLVCVQRLGKLSSTKFFFYVRRTFSR